MGALFPLLYVSELGTLANPTESPPRYRSVTESEDCRAVAQRRRAGDYRITATLRATTRHANLRGELKFYYVYILESVAGGDFYVGITENLRSRLKTHNAGNVPHTAKHRPWRIKTAIAFADKARAIAFEHYLKTSSGKAFTKKRL